VLYPPWHLLDSLPQAPSENQTSYCKVEGPIMLTIADSIRDGLAVRGTTVRCRELFNCTRGKVECIDKDGMVIVAGVDLFNNHVLLRCPPQHCEIV